MSNCIVCLDKRANFNYINEKKGRYCSKCKLINMVDVIHKKCEVCKVKQPTYNYIEKKSPSHCSQCKLNGMINIKSKTCIVCKIKQPTYNYSDKTKAEYCKDCMTSDMIDINNRNKKCIECKTKRANFNYKDKLNAKYCNDCKLTDMINVVDKKCCICNIKIPVFNYEGEKKAKYCGDCKDSNMIDVISKKCSHCDFNYVNRKYKPHCFTCYLYLNPNSEVVRNYKTKENTIMKFIKEKYPNCVLDSVIQGGCSKRRPDGLIEFEEYSIMIEIDENCHKSYEDMCENKRLMEIYRDLGFRPLRIIRFNPDSYTDSDNKKVKSIFSVDNKTKKLKVNSQKELNKRVNILLETLEELINNIKLKSDIEKSIDCTYLFYNNA